MKLAEKSGLPNRLKLTFVQEGEFHQGVITVQAELLANIRAVGLYRAVTDKHGISNFAAGFILGDQLQNASFSG